jgi:hypothetical protein
MAEETFQRSKIDRARKDAGALRWHKALLKLRRENPALQDDARKSVRASSQGKVLLLRRGPILLVASFDAEPAEVKLPDGSWRVLLDSGAAEVRGDRARMRGRGAVVLEHA